MTIASLATAGCLGGLDEELDDADATARLDDVSDHVMTSVFSGSIEAALATPVLSFNQGGEFLTTITHDADTTGWILELEWDASVPVNEELDLWVRTAGAGSVPPEDPSALPPEGPFASATGSSPLRLELAADDFPAEGAFDVIVRAAGPVGVAADQSFTLHVTQFHVVDFDASYSALNGNDDDDY